MNSITLDDILESYETNDNIDIDKKYLEIEQEYRLNHKVLNYYNIILPCFYWDEFKRGQVIRYSANHDKVSCAARIIKVVYTLDGKVVKKLKLVALNKQDESGIWEIFPELYYVFKYDSSVTRLRRSFYKMGITNEESIKNPEKEQEIKNKINLNKIPAKKSKTVKTVKINNKPRTKMVTSKSLKNGNKLSFNKLLKNCPEVKSKIIKSSSIDNNSNNYITRPAPKKINRKHKHCELNLEEDKHYSQIKNITSLLESDSDYGSDSDESNSDSGSGSDESNSDYGSDSNSGSDEY